MDIPTTRIQNAALEGTDVLDFIDTEFNQLLLRLNPNELVSGQPVLVCRDKSQNIVVYAMTSEYDLNVMAVRRATGLLRGRLESRNIWPMYMTVAYEGQHGWYLGHEQIELTKIKNQNYENPVNTSRLIAGFTGR